MSGVRTDISEETLGRIINGDHEAFARMMKAYLPLVMHITARMIADHEDRKDLCQEVFLRVYRNLDGFRGESRLSTWIARIAYNACLNHAQKKRPDLLDDSPWSLHAGECADSDDSAPDAVLEDRDVSEKLRREIDRLPVRYRAVLTLFHLEGMRIEEIAGIMDIPEGTVKNDLFRARRILKDKLLTRYTQEELCGQCI